MTFEEFIVEMTKLSDCFGAEHYRAGRVKMIFQEVSALTVGQWSKIVTALCGENRYPPSLAEIREFAARERERMREHERGLERQEAEAFWQGRYLSDDKRHIVREIKRRALGDMPDAEWNAFMRILERRD